jgi:hypothetical protein
VRPGEDTEHRHQVGSGETQFRQRRDFRVGGEPARRADRQRSQRSVLHVRSEAAGRIHGQQFELSRYRVGQRLRPALVGHVGDLDTGLIAQLLQHQMADRGDAGGGPAQGARTRPGLGQQVSERTAAERWCGQQPYG